MDLSSAIKEMGHEQVVFCNDPYTGLRAIIAIHDTTLGPALGGCRFWNYGSEEEAIFDVLRLSRGMTYKAAVAGLDLGGGKSVIIGDPVKLKSESLFRSFGRFVQSLSGRYITAEDVNVRVADMNWVGKETNYVTGITDRKGGSGDPSPITALGVFSGIRAAVKHKLGKSELKGIRVAVQGVGAVGKNLCALLHKEGADLIVADIDQNSVKKVAEEFKAQAVSSESIHAAKVDVFAPCALGAILNHQTIPEIHASIVAGGANNQLLDENKDAKALQERNILYAPDYVINAGGLINVAHELKGYSLEASKKDATKIYDTLLAVFKNASTHNITTVEASNKMAEDRINTKKQHSNFLKNTFDNQNWIKL